MDLSSYTCTILQGKTSHRAPGGVRGGCGRGYGNASGKVTNWELLLSVVRQA